MSGNNFDGAPISDWIAILFLICLVAVVVILTMCAVFIVGRRLASRNRALAVLACGAVSPSALIGLGVLRLVTVPDLAPPNDAAPMAFVLTIFTAVMLSPISFGVSAAMLLRTRASGGH